MPRLTEHLAVAEAFEQLELDAAGGCQGSDTGIGVADRAKLDHRREYTPEEINDGASVRSRRRGNGRRIRGRFAVSRGRLDGGRRGLESLRRHVRASRLRAEEDPGRRGRGG